MDEPPASPAAQLIPTRTRRKAMDWSLVLASQGIEHSIEHDEFTGWSLTVAATDLDRALTSIRLYRQENRHWHWRKTVFTPGLFFDGRCVVWVLLVLFFYAWSAHADLRTAGMMAGSALTQGEWWRLFTATWLHADLTHLTSNIVFGFLFLGLVMGRYGPGVGLLAAYLAGASGNIIAGLVHEATSRGLGASGVVMGALGLLSFPAFPVLRQRSANAFRLIAGGLMGGMLLFVFVGVSPGTDVVAHLGGFLAGLGLGAMLAFAPQLIHRPWVNLASATLFTAFVVLPWWLALTRPGLGH